MTTITEVIDMLNQVCEDASSTKNLKTKIDQIISILNAEGDLSLKLNKVSHELDELAANSELDSYCRTQLLGIVSALENVTE